MHSYLKNSIKKTTHIYNHKLFSYNLILHYQKCVYFSTLAQRRERNRRQGKMVDQNAEFETLIQDPDEINLNFNDKFPKPNQSFDDS